MSSGRVLWVRVGSDPAHAQELLKARAEVTEVLAHDGKLKVTLVDHEADHSVIADALVRGGAKLLELREDEIGLEEVFMRVTRGDTQ
jgi:hypothetical protein